MVSNGQAAAASFVDAAAEPRPGLSVHEAAIRREQRASAEFQETSQIRALREDIARFCRVAGSFDAFREAVVRSDPAEVVIERFADLQALAQRGPLPRPAVMAANEEPALPPDILLGLYEEARESGLGVPDRLRLELLHAATHAFVEAHPLAFFDAIATFDVNLLGPTAEAELDEALQRVGIQRAGDRLESGFANVFGTLLSMEVFGPISESTREMRDRAFQGVGERLLPTDAGERTARALRAVFLPNAAELRSLTFGSPVRSAGGRRERRSVGPSASSTQFDRSFGTSVDAVVRTFVEAEGGRKEMIAGLIVRGVADRDQATAMLNGLLVGDSQSLANAKKHLPTADGFSQRLRLVAGALERFDTGEPLHLGVNGEHDIALDGQTTARLIEAVTVVSRREQRLNAFDVQHDRTHPDEVRPWYIQSL